MKRLLRKVLVHLIITSFIRANAKGKKTIFKTVLKLVWHRVK